MFGDGLNMDDGKNDRRSRRTRHLLGNALVELMVEKGYSDITVQEILDRADVGRSTFYAHFTDKENLLMSQFETVIRQLERYVADAQQERRSPLPSLELFRHIQQHRRLTQVFMWGRGADMLAQQLQVRLSQIVEHNIGSSWGNGSDTLIPLTLLASFVATTFLMQVRWWFADDMRHTPEYMDEIFQSLVMPAIGNAFAADAHHRS